MSSPDISKYYTGDRPEFVAFLAKTGTYRRALDIGCAAGLFGSSLVKQGNVGACDGIEPYTPVAEIAQNRLGQVWVGGLEAVQDEVPWSDYDMVIMADVLEHLVDPWWALRLIADKTAPNCQLALSVPNVRHHKVVLPLLFKGEFRYQDFGIMDRTHLHFFTRSSLTETLHDCGWKIRAIAPHMKSRYRRWYYPTRLAEPFVAVQYMLVAEKR